MQPLAITILGLSITSSWGNGHATTYRGLVRELARRGHDVVFLERDMPWYADNRDMPAPPFGRTCLYRSLADLKRRFAAPVRDADVVIVGSYVPEGQAVGEWVIETARGLTAFYDIDTPVTVAALERGDCSYLTPPLVAAYDLYLSFTGGALLRRLEREFGSPMARPLYCSADPELYGPTRTQQHWDLGYLGTYSRDRQPGLSALLLEPARALRARRFVVAGPQYPADIAWPVNVDRISHLPPNRHRRFFNAQRFTLNITRADMVRAGWSPSVRLFEAAACATAIISDWWEGLDALFTPGKEVLIARSARDVRDIIASLSESERRAIGRAARARILGGHTAAHRARELEEFIVAARRCPHPAAVAGLRVRARRDRGRVPSHNGLDAPPRAQ